MAGPQAATSQRPGPGPEPEPEPEPEDAPRCLKSDGDRSVWLVRTPTGVPRTLKVWPYGVFTFFKIALGIAQVQRQVRGQRLLARGRIDSPPPIRRWRVGRRGRALAVELELEFVEGRPALDLLETGTGAVSDLHAIASQLGRLVAAHWSARLFNRDLKLSNIIVRASAPSAGSSLSVIDPVGVRRMRRRHAEIARMLERLGAEPTQLGLTIPAGAARLVLREALRPLPPRSRRAALRLLRGFTRDRSPAVSGGRR